MSLILMTLLVVNLKLELVTSCNWEGDERINGSMYAEGPVVLGGPRRLPKIEPH